MTAESDIPHATNDTFPFKGLGSIQLFEWN